MIKLYELLVEALVENDIDLGDKTQEFNEKLELMKPDDQKILINFVKGLNDTEKKEFGFLLNKYPSVEKLEAPQTSLEKRVADEVRKQGIGPGEILFHLELQDSSMVGDTNHDLTVKGKVWEVKKVTGGGMGVYNPKKPETNFKLAKKGVASKFKFNSNLLEIVILIDKIIDNSKIEEEFNDISPQLRKALDIWEEEIIKSKAGGPPRNTPKQAILQGDHNARFRKIMIDIIEIVKDEIKINTNDEFTTVKFGGVGIAPKNKGIDPVKIQQVDDDSVLLNFIGRDTLSILERLNEMPYVREGYFLNDLDAAVEEALVGMPNMIIWGDDEKILIIEENNLNDVLEFSSVTQGDLIIKVKQEAWEKL